MILRGIIMDKRILFNRKLWLSITLVCLFFSIISLFFPILTYIYPSGKSQSFNIFKFLKPDELGNVLSQYTGSFALAIEKQDIPFFAAIAVFSIVAAFAGVITMSAQRPNFWQFVMSMVGLIGTLIPSVLLFIVVISSINYFPGSFQFGAYPIITPFAMGICMYMVTRKHKLTQEEIQAEKIAAQYLHTMGDL